MAERFKIQTLEDYQKKLNTTSPFTLPKTSLVTTQETIKTQKENLEKRLRAVGVNPDNPNDGEVDNRNIIERALNLTPDQNFFFDFLEVIDRPIRSVFGGVEAAIAGENIIEGFWEGLSGQSDVMFTDILDTANIVDKEVLNPIASFAIDLGAEIFLDPLNFLPKGFLRKALGLKAGSKFDLVDIPTSLAKVDEYSVPFIQNIESTTEFLEGVKTADGYFDSVSEFRIFSEEGLEKAQTITEARKKLLLENPSLAKTGGGELEEIYGRDIMRSIFKKDDVLKGEIDVVKFRTNDAKTPDLAILKKVKVGDNTYWIEIGKIEAKGVEVLTGKRLADVIYSSPRLTLTVAEDGSEFVNVGFSEDILKEVSETLLKDFEKAFNLPQGAFKGNITLTDLFVYLNQSKDVLEPLVGSVTTKGSLSYFIKTKTTKTVPLESIRSYVSGPSYGKGTKLKEQLTKVLKGTDESIIDEIIEEINKVRAKYTRGMKGSTLGGTTFNLDFNQQGDFLRNTIRKFLGEKYKSNPFIVYIDKKGVSSILHSDQVIEKLDITTAKLRKSGNQYRFDIGLGGLPTRAPNAVRTLESFQLTDATDDFIKYVLDRNETLEGLVDAKAVVGAGETRKALVETKTPSRAMDFLIGKSKQTDSILQKPAKLALDTIEKLKYTFDLGAGYSNSFKAQLGRIEGKQAFRLNELASRIFENEKALKTVDPNAGRYLKELLEMGVTPDELAQGLRLTHTKTANTLDVIDYYIRNSKKGKIAILDAFETDLDLKNAETAMNKMLEAFGIDGTASIVKTLDGKGTYLKINSDLSVDEIAKMIGVNPVINRNYLEFSYGTRTLDSKFRDFVDIYNEEYIKMLDLHDEVVNIIVNEIGVENLNQGVIRELGYYRHTLTKEAKKALRDTSPIARSKFSQEGSNLFASRTYEAGTDAINSVTKDLMEIDYDLITDDGFSSLRDMVESALKVETQNKVLGALLQESRALNEVGGNISFFKVVENNRQAANELGPSYVFIADSLETEFSKMFSNFDDKTLREWRAFMEDMGFVKGKTAIAINKSVYETLKGVNSAFVEVPEFLKVYDNVLNTWKSTTLISPGFHIRNFFGNFFNMAVGGMPTPQILKYQNIAVGDFNTYFRYRDAYFQEGIDAIPEVFQEAFENVRAYYDGGLAQTRKGLRDFEKIESLALQGYDPTNRGFRQTYNKVVQANFHAAEYIDDIQRYAMYRWALEQDDFFTEIAQLRKSGATDEIIKKYKNSVAREKVMNSLFDYTNLTSFEKDFMKRLFPFYTFMKNNFIFQAKSFIDNPKVYRRIGQFTNLWNENIGGINPEDLPTYARDNMWLALPFSATRDDEEAISFLRLNLPATDFAEIVENPFKKGVNSLAFPLKIPIEYGFMRDSFTGREFQRFPGQETSMEPGTGVAAFLRDERGSLAISSNPVIQKLMNDIGLRVPQSYLTIAFDILDGFMGYQSGGETVTDVLDRLSITGTQKVSQLETTKIYEDLAYLRDLRSLYEQQSGRKLPSLDELGLKD